MSGNGEDPENVRLDYHLKEFLAGRRKFENAAQSAYRMIIERGVEERMRAGQMMYEFNFFREGKKQIVGWHYEINDFVHFIKNAAGGGSAKEMAIVFVGEPGNGKTWFIDYVCQRYREFLSRPENQRFTFKFIGLDEALGYDPHVRELDSMTFEDPMILAMNLFPNRNESIKFLKKVGFTDDALADLYDQRRPLGASSEYLWRKLVALYGEVEKALEHIKIVPVPMMESLGTTTGKYASKDKITSSSVDLVGEESLQRMLYLPLGDPNKFDLQRGALARVAGGGIHFVDEMYKNKIDLLKIYLGVVQDRIIQIDGYIWPIDTLILATSNTDEYKRFSSQGEEAPIIDRCRFCYVGHNTDYKLQHELTSYAMGSKPVKTILGKPMHIDPNLNHAASVAVVLTRILKMESLTPIEAMKLEAGEAAGQKGVGALNEAKKTANASPDVTKRWGQTGLGHRDLGRALQILAGTPESNKGECMVALDVFDAFDRVILDGVSEAVDRDKYKNDMREAKKLYRQEVKRSVANAYREDPKAVEKDVMSYVNMVVGMSSEKEAPLGPGRTFRRKDPATGEIIILKIDDKFVDAVEDRLGLKTTDAKRSHRDSILKILGQRATNDPNYNFMDNEELVQAVVDVRLESDVGTASSLVGALTNRTNEENAVVYSRMIKTMMKKLGYCPTCAERTITYYCIKQDES